LSGVLSDGTPFAFSSNDNDSYRGVQPNSLTFALQSTSLPAIGPPLVTASQGNVPFGIREGQTLLVDAGGVAPAHFNAGRGSSVIVQDGGRVGADLEVIAARLQVTGGTIGDNLDVFQNSIADISGGIIGRNFQTDQSTINITGGSIGVLQPLRSTVSITGNSTISSLQPTLSTVDISGGLVQGDLNVYSSTVNIFGGVFGTASQQSNEVNVRVYASSTVNISGGLVRGFFEALGPSTINISGGAVTGGFSLIQASHINLSGGSVGPGFDAFLSNFKISGGEFRVDGVPVSGTDVIGSTRQLDLTGARLLTGTLADGTPFAFSTDDSDFGGGETITLEVKQLPTIGSAKLLASRDQLGLGVRSGQTLIVDPGGKLPDIYNAGLGSHVQVVPGGSIGAAFEAVGAAVDISGGDVGDGFQAFRGSTVNIAGGQLGIGFGAFNGAAVHVFGQAFFLDGAPISNLTPGASQSVAQRNATLSGVLADGTPFSFDLSDGTIPFGSSGDFFDANAVLTITLVKPVLIGDYNGNGVVDAADYVVWRDNLGRTVVNGNGADGNFNGVVDDADYYMWASAFGRTMATMLGDYNGDGIVDAADYTVWRDTLGQSVANGTGADGNFDGVIDGSDYAVWQSNFGHRLSGSGSGAGGSAAVPEPASLILALILVPLVACGRRLLWR
jgi:hypothetical protein